MLRSIGKQFEESVESVLGKMNAVVHGEDLQKGKVATCDHTVLPATRQR